MKKLALFFAISLSGLFAAQNFELSTLRIGEYKIFMKKSEAEKLAQKKFSNFSDYDKRPTVNYYGEIIELVGYDSYDNGTETTEAVVQQLVTKSKKFRTKSGMGVGNTRDELINMYKNYPNFSVNQGWTDDGVSKTESYFRLTDNDAGTELSFKMINNIVVEVSIYTNEGC